MFALLWLKNSKVGRIVAISGAVVLTALLGIGIYRSWQPEFIATPITTSVTSVVVDRPVLTEKLVTQVITDPKDKALIKALMAENQALRVNVTELTKTVGVLKQTGGGTVVTEPTVTSTGEPGPISYHFSDWHLDFRTDTKTATYTLSQRFEVLNTTGRTKEGQPVSLVKLFELGPNDERIPVTDLKTTAVFADPTVPHWMLGFNVQGGAAFTRTNTGQHEPGGLVAVQWLKRGKTKAAEDTSLAILSPAVFLNTTTQDIGVLPISVNLGRLPRQPFTNLWVSPYVSKAQRIGVALTATF